MNKINIYPDSPGFAKDSDTSRFAAETLTIQRALQQYVLAVLAHVAEGLTVDQCKSMAENHFRRGFDRSTMAARFTELTEGGKIHPTPETRMSPRKRPAHVYKLGPDPRGPKPPANDPEPIADPLRELAQLFWDAFTLKPDGSAVIHLAPLDVHVIEGLAVRAGLRRS